MTLHLMVCLCFLLQLLPLDASDNDLAQCVVVKSDIFTNCTYDHEMFNDQLKKQEMKNGSSVSCSNVCLHSFNVTFVQQQLYNIKVFHQFSTMMDACCGNCARFNITNNIRHLSQLDKTLLDTSDVVFPMIARRSVKELYGFYYIPVFDVPTAYFFTERATDNESMAQLIHACLNTWPLIVTCLLLAFISGFIVWLMERKENRGEFPKPFLAGLAEGFWWSFVSMTTVGYGDKTPRTFAARLFAVVWILIGITIFSLLTGSLTNKVIDINEYMVPSLYGKQVGGLSSRLHEATLVAHHGGVFKGFEYNDTVSGIVDLILSLDKKAIDGYVISRPTYYHFAEEIRLEKNKAFAEQIQNIQLDMNEKKYIDEKLTIGMLVKTKKSYAYFEKYFEDNWLQIQDCNEFEMNYKAKQIELDATESHFEGYFHTVFYVIVAILIVICLFGVLQVVKRKVPYYPCKRTELVSNVQDENEC